MAASRASPGTALRSPHALGRPADPTPLDRFPERSASTPWSPSLLPAALGTLTGPLEQARTPSTRLYGEAHGFGDASVPAFMGLVSGRGRPSADQRPPRRPDPARGGPGREIADRAGASTPGAVSSNVGDWARLNRRTMGGTRRAKTALVECSRRFGVSWGVSDPGFEVTLWRMAGGPVHCILKPCRGCCCGLGPCSRARAAVEAGPRFVNALFTGPPPIRGPTVNARFCPARTDDDSRPEPIHGHAYRVKARYVFVCQN